MLTQLMAHVWHNVSSILRFLGFSDALLWARIRWQTGEPMAFFPKQLAIEVTNYCNAKCVMCPLSKMTRAKGLMDMEFFRSVVDAVAESGAPITLITHAGLGEP